MVYVTAVGLFISLFFFFILCHIGVCFKFQYLGFAVENVIFLFTNADMAFYSPVQGFVFGIKPGVNWRHLEAHLLYLDSIAHNHKNPFLFFFFFTFLTRNNYHRNGTL